MNNNNPAPFPFHVDLNNDPNPSHEFFFQDHVQDQSSSSHMGISSHLLFPPPQPHQDHRLQQANLPMRAQGELLDDPPQEEVINRNNGLSDHDHNHNHDHDHRRECCSVKWMSSKMRIMKKMISGKSPAAVRKFESDPAMHVTVPPAAANLENDGGSSNSNRSSCIENNPINRVCADCNTTKTPLWRSGPRGPKSLCNACGIRQRKARRALAAAAAAANGESPPYPKLAPSQNTKVQQKKKRSMSPSSSTNNNDNGGNLQLKKKRKILHPPGTSRKLCFEEFCVKLGKHISSFQGVFPQDEEEAAILLMALSYGLVHG